MKAKNFHGINLLLDPQEMEWYHSEWEVQSQYNWQSET